MGRRGTKEHEDSELVRFQWKGGEQKNTKTVSGYDSNGKVGNKRARRHRVGTIPMGRRGTKEHEHSELVRLPWEGGEQKNTKTVSSYDFNGKAGNKRARRQ